MARPLKNGLDYFPFDVDFFSDRRIKRLRAAYGSEGVNIYIYLLCDIYHRGYYTVYDEDLVLDIADVLGISANLATQVMNYLFSRSLLRVIEGKLAEPVKVITAESIQRRYQAAKKGAKRDIEVDAQFWVLDEDATESFIKVLPEKGFSRKNEDDSQKNNDENVNKSTKESKIKESRVNESKAKDSRAEDIPAAAPQPSDSEARDKLIYDYGEEACEHYTAKVRGWYAGKGREPDDLYGIARKWLEKDGAAPVDHSMDEYMKLMNRFDL